MLDTTSYSLILRLLAACVCGIIVGLDREHNNKPAGVRTQMLVCVGSALLTSISIELSVSHMRPGLPAPDPARLAAQIVSGIGFIGAGAILKGENRVTGVTTAATLWVTAAIGIALGAGYYVGAMVTLLFVLLLTPLARLQYRLGLKEDFFTCFISAEDAKEAEALIDGVRIKYYVKSRNEEKTSIVFSGSQETRNTVSKIFAQKNLSFVMSSDED